MISFLVHLSLRGLLMLGLLNIPSSSQRSPPAPPHWNENHESNQLSIEIPMLSTGMASSKVLLVPIQLGEPPQTLHLIPDTGSDATWVYCDRLPHLHNVSDGSSHRVFGHSRSSTFASIHCSSPLCTGAAGQCSSPGDLCNYTHEYVDGTSTTGYWSTDTVTVKSDERSDLKFHGMMFGCSSRDFTNLADADGILGLSPHHPSFTSHLAPRFGYTFSYLLSRASNENLLVFGRTKRSGLSFDSEQMLHTRLMKTDSFFHVQVSGLLFDGVPLDIPRWAWKFDAGNYCESSGAILDTGTTFTYVPEVAFEAIRDLYAEFFQQYGSATVTSSEVCYNPLAPEFDGIRIPGMAIEFEDGARFVPREENLFYEDEDGSSCLGIRAMDQRDGSIIGSNLQAGYFWEYDLLKQRVGFAPLC